MKNSIRFSATPFATATFSLGIALLATNAAHSASYCEAWSKYLQEVTPGLMSKDAPVTSDGDPAASRRYRGNFKRTKTRDIECDSTFGCNYKGEASSLTGGIRVSNELVTSMPKTFASLVKKFSDQVNAFQNYSKKRKPKTLLDAKQTRMLKEIAATAAKGREQVVQKGLEKGCFNTYERDLNARISEKAAELSKIAAAQAAEEQNRMPANAAPEAAPALEAPAPAPAGTTAH